MKHRQETQDWDKAKKTVSTLLIPSQYLKHYNEQCGLHKGRNGYFKHLLDHFASEVKRYEKRMLKLKDDKWKTHYQGYDLSLNRCNFRPCQVRWEQCRLIANSFGVSMCYLFVFLMELEISGVEPNKSHKSRSTTYKFKKKVRKFYSCTRRIDFHMKSLKRELYFQC